MAGKSPRSRAYKLMTKIRTGPEHTLTTTTTTLFFVCKELDSLPRKIAGKLVVAGQDIHE